MLRSIHLRACCRHFERFVNVVSHSFTEHHFKLLYSSYCFSPTKLYSANQEKFQRSIHYKYQCFLYVFHPFLISTEGSGVVESTSPWNWRNDLKLMEFNYRPSNTKEVAIAKNKRERLLLFRPITNGDRKPCLWFPFARLPMQGCKRPFLN